MSSPKTLSDARRYDAYIDSGTEWLGEVPAHWQITRIKGVFRAFGSGSTPISSEPAYYDEGTIPWLNTADLNNGIIYDTRRRVTPKAVAETSLRMYPKGTLAIAMYGQGETRGNVGLMAIESTANQASLMMHRSFNSVPRFMLWWFVARKYSIRQINIGATQPNMNQDFVRNLVICLPPLPEQQAIAAYLDAKTAQIDRKIDLLTQKAAKYRQLKQSLINEAVTRGLDKSVPMKDSGVAWMGEMPAHWDIRRIKDLAFLQSGDAITADQIEDNCPYPVYGGNGIRGYFTSYTNDGEHVLIGRQGALCGNINFAVGRFWASEHAVVAYLKGPVHTKWFGEILRVMNLNQYSISAAQPGLSMERIKQLLLPVPPYDERKAIANHIDFRTAQTDKVLDTISTQITKLKELRKALINDVVTGKLRVT